MNHNSIYPHCLLYNLFWYFLLMKTAGNALRSNYLGEIFFLVTWKIHAVPLEAIPSPVCSQPLPMRTLSSLRIGPKPAFSQEISSVTYTKSHLWLLTYMLTTKSLPISKLTCKIPWTRPVSPSVYFNPSIFLYFHCYYLSPSLLCPLLRLLNKLIPFCFSIYFSSHQIHLPEGYHFKT